MCIGEKWKEKVSVSDILILVKMFQPEIMLSRKVVLSDHAHLNPNFTGIHWFTKVQLCVSKELDFIRTKF